jgi:PX domain
MFLQFKKRCGAKSQEYVARINNSELRLDHVYYTVIVISNADGGVKVNRKRYSDLKKMHDRISQIVSNMKISVCLPCFPGRRFFTKTNNSPDNITKRMEELTIYLN